MDIYLLEAIINGILLGGVLALTGAGAQPDLRVIDVVWIAYADVVMCGMYAIYWLYASWAGRCRSPAPSQSSAWRRSAFSCIS